MGDVPRTFFAFSEMHFSERLFSDRFFRERRVVLGTRSTPPRSANCWSSWSYTTISIRKTCKSSTFAPPSTIIVWLLCSKAAATNNSHFASLSQAKRVNPERNIWVSSSRKWTISVSIALPPSTMSPICFLHSMASHKMFCFPFLA